MKKKILLYISAVCLALILNNISIPHYEIIAPGVPQDVRRLITLELKERSLEPVSLKQDGRLFLTTVVTGKATLLNAIYAAITPWAEISYSEPGEHINEKLKERMGLSLMEESKKIAIFVALRKAGYEAKMEGDGVEINEIFSGSHANGVLRKGDLIVALDSHPVMLREELLELLSAKKAGEEVKIKFMRDGKVNNTVIHTIQSSDKKNPKAILGIYAHTRSMRVKSSISITIESDDIEGSSAGLMLTIGVLEQLLQTDLAKGFRIAGTGTILPDGKIGEVAGIRQKVVAARLAGAQLFFAPAGNVKEALNSAVGIRIVPVKSLDDALVFLKTLSSI